MAARFASSNDPRVDRRYDWARGYREAGDHAAAVDLLTEAVALAPGWAPGHLALGEALAAVGRIDEALAALDAARTLDPSDELGAGVRRAALTGETPATLPAAYVAALFDGYADRFDRHLVGVLEYRAPRLLREAVEGVVPKRRFARMIDLGCGTGLAGEAFAEIVDEIVGIDLSAEMLAHRRVEKLYAHAIHGDVVEELVRLDGMGDLIVAADVLVYIGDLAPLFDAVAERLASGGLFAFSVQAMESADGPHPPSRRTVASVSERGGVTSGTLGHPTPPLRADPPPQGEGGRQADPTTDVVLGPDLRYRHSSGYLKRLAAEHDLVTLTLTEAVTRQDEGRDVPGLLAVMMKP